MIDVRELYLDNQEMDPQEPTARNADQGALPVDADAQILPPSIMDIDEKQHLKVSDAKGVQNEISQVVSDAIPTDPDLPATEEVATNPMDAIPTIPDIPNGHSEKLPVDLPPAQLPEPNDNATGTNVGATKVTQSIVVPIAAESTQEEVPTNKVVELEPPTGNASIPTTNVSAKEVVDPTPTTADGDQGVEVSKISTAVGINIGFLK